jgi:hypothetical protein
MPGTLLAEIATPCGIILPVSTSDEQPTRNEHTQSSAANEDGTIGFTSCDLLGGSHGNMWVGSLVFVGIYANINDLSNTRVFLKVCLENVLVRDPSFL